MRYEIYDHTGDLREVGEVSELDDQTVEVDYISHDAITATETDDDQTDIQDAPPDIDDDPVGHIQDGELNQRLLDTIELMDGIERVDPLLRAAEHLNGGTSDPADPGRELDPNAGYKKLLDALPAYELSVAISDVTTPQADRLLRHSLEEGTTPEVDPPNMVVKGVARLVETISETGRPPAAAELDAAHNALWTAGEIGAVQPALAALANGKRIGLSLNETGNLVEQAAVSINTDLAGADTHQLADTLGHVERKTDGRAVKEVFGSFRFVDPGLRQEVYTGLRAALDQARAHGVPHSDLLRLIRDEMNADPDNNLQTALYDLQTQGYDELHRRAVLRRHLQPPAIKS